MINDDNSLTLRGTVHGSRIDLTSSPGLSDGAEVEVVVRLTSESKEQERIRKNREAGIAEWWTDEDDRILEEIQKVREGSFYRELPE